MSENKTMFYEIKINFLTKKSLPKDLPESCVNKAVFASLSDANGSVPSSTYYRSDNIDLERKNKV